ncbi:MAG: hypothetical protein ACRDRH_19280 [Pseudonocardia sp.]
MVETDPQESEAGIPRAVRRSEATALVAAFQQAQTAEATIRQILAQLGIPAEAARPVTTVDDDARPAVHPRLDAVSGISSCAR